VNDSKFKGHGGVLDAVLSAVLHADEHELAEDAVVAGVDLIGDGEHMRARFLERVALSYARDAGLSALVDTVGPDPDFEQSMGGGGYDGQPMPLGIRRYPILRRVGAGVVDGEYAAYDEVPGFFVLVTDISEIKRGIISIVADAIISVDANRRIVIFNKGAEAIFGYTGPEVIGRDLGMLLPAHTDWQSLAAIATDVDATGADASRPSSERQVTMVGVRKNGEEFPAEATISKLKLGRMTLLTVALRDITERKRVEMEQMILAEAGAVLDSSLDYAHTLETIGELLVRHVADMCIIDMFDENATLRRMTVTHADPTNAAACKTLAKLSLESASLLTTDVLETRQPRLLDQISLELLESCAQSEEHRGALRELAPRSGLVVPMLSGDTVLGALFLGSSHPNRFGDRDIVLATELARRAALAIENARRHEAEQRATQARDEVLEIVAHDLRSPLHSIHLAAQLLERKLPKAETAKCQDYVAIIMQSVERANRLVQDLLDISRMEAGVLTLARDVVATRAVIVDALGSLRLLASEASIQLRLELEEELPAIWADQARLLQVLENLIGNAIKFTPEGGCITVTATRGCGEVQFSVADTGPGIPENCLPQVFDRFWQAERASRRGAGLGLPICKGIIEAHGGRIWAESTLGVGTKFFFTVPTQRNTQSLRPDAPRSSPVEKPSQASAPNT
jgi:PAS domain S-box-containing protein